MSVIILDQFCIV